MILHYAMTHMDPHPHHHPTHTHTHTHTQMEDVQWFSRADLASAVQLYDQLEEGQNIHSECMHVVGGCMRAGAYTVSA